MTEQTILTRENFSFPAVGSYSFEGIDIFISERLTGYGSGKKTVYTATIAGLTTEKKDITFYKKMFGIAPGQTAPKTPRASRPASVPAAAVEPEPAPVVVPAVAPVNSEEIRHARFEDVKTLVGLDIPVYLYGPAGSGKNVICKQIADACGLDFYFSNSVTQEYKITGFIDAGGVYHETQFFKAFKNGGLFMLDELDASIPEVLICLNAALANRYFDFPCGRISAHPNFRVIAAGNTCGRGASEEYSGRYPIDAATMDRFAFVNIEYDFNVEKKIAKNNAAIIEFIHALRESARALSLSIVLGYRAISRLAQMSGVFSPVDALNMSIIKGMDVDTVRGLCSNYHGAKSNIYFSALHEIASNLA